MTSQFNDAHHVMPVSEQIIRTGHRPHPSRAVCMGSVNYGYLNALNVSTELDYACELGQGRGQGTCNQRVYSLCM